MTCGAVHNRIEQLQAEYRRLHEKVLANFQREDRHLSRWSVDALQQRENQIVEELCKLGVDPHEALTEALAHG